MKEVKTPKKPLIFYYLIAMLVVMALNAFLFPTLMNRSIKEVDYSQFLKMVREGQVKQVQVEDELILFADTAERPAI